MVCCAIIVDYLHDIVQGQLQYHCMDHLQVEEDVIENTIILTTQYLKAMLLSFVCTKRVNVSQLNRNTLRELIAILIGRKKQQLAALNPGLLPPMSKKGSGYKSSCELFCFFLFLSV